MATPESSRISSSSLSSATETPSTIIESTSPPALPEPLPQNPSNGEKLPALNDPRFQILERLGGGMADVYLAHQIKEDTRDILRKVVLKRIRKQTDDADARNRHEREAKILMNLKDRNVVTIHDAFESQGVLWLCLEYLEEGTLESYMRPERKDRIGQKDGARRRPLNERVVARLVKDLSETMKRVHAEGVWHRDLKPSNILLEKDENGTFFGFTAKITDFGLAWMADENPSTTTGRVLGTQNYISPEAAGGSPSEIDAQTDVYGLGAILFDLLTGSPPGHPFQEEKWFDKIRAGLSDVSCNFRDICLSCLQREKKERYKSAEQLATALGRFLNPANPTDNSRQHHSPVLVAMLRSGDLDYTRDIRDGFRQELIENNRMVEIIDRFGPSIPGKASEEIWNLKFRELQERQSMARGYDYYVGIGTKACLVLREKLGQEFGQTPFLFLALTNPRHEQFVQSTGAETPDGKRSDDSQIAGLGYTSSANDTLIYIKNRLFPGFDRLKIRFVYWDRFPQDEVAAEDLRKLKVGAGWPDDFLTFKRVRRFPKLADLEDPKVLYFGWYTFSMMFEDMRGIEILKKRNVIATARGTARDGLALAAVCPDDWVVGRDGAKILIHHHITAEKLGTVPVRMPPLHHWINTDLLSRLEIHPDLAEKAIQGAYEIFGSQPQKAPRKEGAGLARDRKRKCVISSRPPILPFIPNAVAAWQSWQCGTQLPSN